MFSLSTNIVNTNKYLNFLLISLPHLVYATGKPQLKIKTTVQIGLQKRRVKRKEWRTIAFSSCLGYVKKHRILT